jgi:hypothetical protein
MNCPHCGTEVDEHEAKRCLSAWVHADVMGRKLPDHNWETDTYCDCLPDYSTDIAAAWGVLGHWIEKMDDKYLYLEFVKSAAGPSWSAYSGVHAFGGDSAPLAICRAALKAQRLT